MFIGCGQFHASEAKIHGTSSFLIPMNARGEKKSFLPRLCERNTKNNAFSIQTPLIFQDLRNPKTHHAGLILYV